METLYSTSLRDNNIRLKIIANQCCFKAQLPQNQQHPIQQLDPNTTGETGLNGPDTTANLGA